MKSILKEIGNKMNSINLNTWNRMPKTARYFKSLAPVDIPGSNDIFLKHYNNYGNYSYNNCGNNNYENNAGNLGSLVNPPPVTSIIDTTNINTNTNTNTTISSNTSSNIYITDTDINNIAKTEKSKMTTGKQQSVL